MGKIGRNIKYLDANCVSVPMKNDILRLKRLYLYTSSSQVHQTLPPMFEYIHIEMIGYYQIMNLTDVLVSFLEVPL